MVDSAHSSFYKRFFPATMQLTLWPPSISSSAGDVFVRKENGRVAAGRNAEMNLFVSLKIVYCTNTRTWYKVDKITL